MAASRNLTPLVGWHPSAGLSAWLEAEVQRRGGGRGVRSAILEEALAAYRDAVDTSPPAPLAKPERSCRLAPVLGAANGGRCVLWDVTVPAEHPRQTGALEHQGQR